MNTTSRKRRLIKREDGTYHKETQSEKLIRHALEAHGLNYLQECIISGIKVDFYLPDMQIIIEVDGETHLTTEQIKKDHINMTIFKRQGYRVIRIKAIEAYSPAFVRRLIQDIHQEKKIWKKATRQQPLLNTQLKEQLNALKIDGKL